MVILLLAVVCTFVEVTVSSVHAVNSAVTSAVGGCSGDAVNSSACTVLSVDALVFPRGARLCMVQ